MEPSLSRDQASPARANRASANPGSANLVSTVHLPPPDGGHWLAEMARRDLDAALQLLADRAQYITGATGAAIALRRNGMNDMLCRASAGSNAPELGALLSTEFGLSGESVRTRQPLRCDDAECDVRVNREVCRQLGIASVVVMPVVNDDGVLGVFELFSGRVNAFGERDLSAVQRLSEMVETAVRLAEATEHLPERLKAAELSATAVGTGDAEEDRVLEGPELVSGDLLAEELNLDDLVLDEFFVKEPEPVAEASGKMPEVAIKESVQSAAPPSAATEAVAQNAANVVQSVKVETPTLPQAAGEVGTLVTTGAVATTPVKPKAVVAEAVVPSPVEPKQIVPETLPTTPVEPKSTVRENAAATPAEPKAVVPENTSAQPQSAQPVPAPSEEAIAPKKPLFWSAVPNPADQGKTEEDGDRSHVPPVLRGLRKCEVCGFPVSAGRVLCVECEEKKWRGQLRVPQGSGARQVETPPATAPTGPPKEARAFAAAQAAAASTAVPTRRMSAPAAASSVSAAASAVVKESGAGTAQPSAVVRGPLPATHPAPLKPAEKSVRTSTDFVLSAGIGNSQSWFSTNKYVIAAVLLVVAVAVTAVFLLR
jgi:GAF domain-containing protein